jgi:predicted nicotinamide N-methyase
MRVTFTDYDATALRFAADNAKANGYSNFRTMVLDWRNPPPGLRVPVVLASDVTYEFRNVDPLVELLRKVLLPGGLCLLTDQDRQPAAALREALGRAGFAYTPRMMRAGEPGGQRHKGTLYRVTAPA